MAKAKKTKEEEKEVLHHDGVSPIEDAIPNPPKEAEMEVNIIEQKEAAKPEAPKPTVREELPRLSPIKTLTKDEIMQFLAGRKEFVGINTFLKSFVRKETDIRELSRITKKCLRELVEEHKIVLDGDAYLRLDKHHYPDSTTGVTHYYNFNDIPIEAKVV